MRNCGIMTFGLDLFKKIQKIIILRLETNILFLSLRVNMSSINAIHFNLKFKLLYETPKTFFIKLMERKPLE